MQPPTPSGMTGVAVYQFEITARAQELIAFGAQPGAQLRGALYNALSRQFCSETGFEHTRGHHNRCPVCWLLANENAENDRGRDLPRPLILQPPIDTAVIPATQTFQFGIRLVGETAFSAFKFVIRALDVASKQGVGSGRGRFTLETVRIVQPFTGRAVSLLKNRRLTLPPNLSIQQADIDARVADLPTDRIKLRFLTPLRIGEHKRLMHEPALGILLRRLVDRCQAMAAHYGDPAAYDAADWRALYLRLAQIGDEARLVHDDTRWLDVQSGSRRRGTTSPIGGLVGTAAWEGDLASALPWLLWGQILHVGKSTVKGNGWYTIGPA